MKILASEMLLKAWQKVVKSYAALQLSSIIYNKKEVAKSV
jgi:hypothetical protein